MGVLAAPDEIVPYLVFALPWILAVWELRNGLKTGRMRAFRRSDGQDLSDGTSLRLCSRSQTPKSFWCLFVFYLLITIFVPIGMAYVFTHPPTDPPTNPGPGVIGEPK